MSMYGFSSSMTLLSESGVLLTTDSVESKRRMSVLFEAMKVVVGPLKYCELKAFVVETKELVV